MEKKTFLGFDFTPRWALWAENAELKRELHEARRLIKKTEECGLVESIQKSFENAGKVATQVKDFTHIISDYYHQKREIDSLKKSLRTAEAERVEALKRCAELKEQLARYERPRDSKGRFCKKTK